MLPVIIAMVGAGCGCIAPTIPTAIVGMSTYAGNSAAISQLVVKTAAAAAPCNRITVGITEARENTRVGACAVVALQSTGIGQITTGRSEGGLI